MAINFGNCMNNSSFSTSSSSSSSSPLDHVVIVIRHGDRAPLISFPFDRTKMDELWPMGYGHLTAEGKRRMYRLGSFLRRRYHRRLPGKLLTPRDVYIRSSAIERCLESSELIAASLCPPQGVWIWNTNLGEQWQPLPIHSVPKYRDGVSIIDRSWSLRKSNIHFYSRSFWIQHHIVLERINFQNRFFSLRRYENIGKSKKISYKMWPILWINL